MTEMICVSREGRITPGCGGLYADEHTAAWARIVDFVHANGGEDRRAARALGPQGLDEADVGGEDEPLPDGNWPLIAPSPLPYLPGTSQRPREMTRADMDAVRDQFVASARARRRRVRPARAPHGPRLPALVVPLAAHQPARRRVRRLARNARAARSRCSRRAARVAGGASRCPCGSPPPTGTKGGFDGDEAVAFAALLKRAGCDIVDVSCGQVWPEQRPAYGRSYQTPFADRIRHEVGIPTIAVGAISSYDDVNTIVLVRPRRPVRARAPAPLRPALDPARRRRAGPRRRVGAAVPLGLAAAGHRQGRRDPPGAGAALRPGPPTDRGAARALAAEGDRMSRVVVVTGGTRGIGRAVVERFAAGARGRARPRGCDVTDEAAVAETFERIGPVDVLVNNAGVSSSAPLARTVARRLARADRRQRHGRVPVHARGAAGHARARLRPGRHGRLDGGPRRRALHGGLLRLQAAAVGLMRAVAAEVAGTGVTANAVCPAFVRTDMTRRSVERIVSATGRSRPRRRPRWPRPRRSGGCSSPRRWPSPWPSSPPPRRARSTARP